MSVRTRCKAPHAARNGASEHAAQVAKREVAQCRAQSRLAVDHGKGSRRAACTHCSEMNLRRAEAAHKARQPVVSALESHAELPPCHPTLQAQIAPATSNAARAPREGLLVSRRRAAYFVQTPARRSELPVRNRPRAFPFLQRLRQHDLARSSHSHRRASRGRLSPLCGGARGS
jgi:hypothetical protein